MAATRKRKPKRPKKPNLRKLVKKAFSLWSDCGRLMHGNKCELCGIQNKEINENGKPTVLNVHHLVPRENKALRFDLRNACLLCRNHHKYARNSAHKGALLFYEWFRNYRPDDHSYLLRHVGDPPVETVEEVQAVIEKLEFEKKNLIDKLEMEQNGQEV